MKILILKPSSLGDVVQALPVLRLLKLHYPESEIHWWVSSRFAPLLKGDPDLTDIIYFKRGGFGNPARWGALISDIRWLRSKQFDMVIDLQGLARSGAIAWLANGKLLVGLDEAREGARGFYDIVVRRASYHTHAVDWYLSVLRELKVPIHWDFDWLPERAEVATAVKTKWQTDGARWIALQPGARWLTKRWPVDHFTTLVKQVAADKPDVRFVVLGSKEDKSLGEALTNAEPKRCLNLAGQTSMPEMIEWLRICDLLVTNDTGPMHVAAALRKPVVAVFGPTEPRRTGPYGQLDHVMTNPVPCSPCFKKYCTWVNTLECLRGISPDAVFKRVQTLLG